MKILSVDIGGSFIKYALCDENGVLSEKGRIATPQTGRDELIEAVGGIFDAHREAIEGLALSMPGIIDPQCGYVYMGGALEYNNGFNIMAALAERCPGVRISVYNDAKCAAQAEVSAGALKGVKDGAVIILGTMIGGGIVIDGKVRQGTHFAAGEISYILSDRACAPGYDTVWGRRCSCHRLCRELEKAKRLPENSVSGEDFFDLIEAGDESAKTVLKSYCKELAVQLFNLQTVLDLERIAVGGGISARPALFEYLRAELDAMYSASPYYVPRAETVPCRFGADANLVGAAECFIALYSRSQPPFSVSTSSRE